VLFSPSGSDCLALLCCFPSESASPPSDLSHLIMAWCRDVWLWCGRHVVFTQCLGTIFTAMLACAGTLLAVLGHMRGMLCRMLQPLAQGGITVWQCTCPIVFPMLCGCCDHSITCCGHMRPLRQHIVCRIIVVLVVQDCSAGCRHYACLASVYLQTGFVLPWFMGTMALPYVYTSFLRSVSQSCTDILSSVCRSCRLAELPCAC
jgi:hypothetical protein